MAHPSPPSRIGKVTRRTYIDGSPMVYEVLDEIVLVCSNNPGKALYLQMLKFADDGREEMRFCYYMIGHRPRARGKWLYGQFAPMVSKEDFEQIMSLAKQKGWIR